MTHTRYHTLRVGRSTFRPDLQPLRRGFCTARRMVTTNLLELVHELERMSAVHVHDHLDTIELQIAKPGNVETIDDLVCDALFVDPIGRSEDPLYWLVQLYKRDSLRSASDMHVVGGTDRSLYVLEPAA